LTVSLIAAMANGRVIGKGGGLRETGLRADFGRGLCGIEVEMAER